MTWAWQRRPICTPNLSGMWQEEHLSPGIWGNMVKPWLLSTNKNKNSKWITGPYVLGEKGKTKNWNGNVALLVMITNKGTEDPWWVGLSSYVFIMLNTVSWNLFIQTITKSIVQPDLVHQHDKEEWVQFSWSNFILGEVLTMIFTSGGDSGIQFPPKMQVSQDGKIPRLSLAFNIRAECQRISFLECSIAQLQCLWGFQIQMCASSLSSLVVASPGFMTFNSSQSWVVVLSALFCIWLSLGLNWPKRSLRKINGSC